MLVKEFLKSEQKRKERRRKRFIGKDDNHLEKVANQRVNKLIRKKKLFGVIKKDKNSTTKTTHKPLSKAQRRT